MRKPGDMAGSAGETKPEGRKVSRRKLRAEAEKKITRSTGKSALPKKQDPDKLMHELQVHCVELETQNEQLRRTEAALKSREQGYRLVADYSIKLKDISILLNEASDLKGLFNSVAESFRLFTSSIAATFTIFNKENQTLQVVSLSADPAARPKIEAIFGPEIFEMRMPVSPDIRDELLNQKIRRMKDLYELSLGVISQDNSDLFMQSVGCKQIVACSISDGTDIAGVCAAYLPASLPMVPDYVLNPYLYMVRLAIKRMQTEEALRESETRYSLLSKHTTDTVWLMDMDLKTIYQSPSVEKMRGFAAQEMMELPLEKQVTPESLKLAMGVLSEELHRGRDDPDYNPVCILDLELYRKDGTTFWSESKFSAIRDKNGRLVSILGEGRDITERKEAEEALSESEEKYRFLADNTHDILWTMDLNMHTTYASPSIESALGFTPEERMKQDITEQVTPASLSMAQDTLVRELEYEQSGQFDPNRAIIIESEYYHKDGSTLWFESVISSIRDDKGILIGFQGLSRNIMERKEAEESLRKSEEQYRLLAEHTADIVALMDMDLKVTYQSPSSEKVRGYTIQELSDLPLEKNLAPESLKLGFEALYRELPGIEADPGYNPVTVLDLEYYRKDGTTVWLESKFSIVRDVSGKPVSILLEARDITERRLAEEKLLKGYESVKKTLDDAINTMVKIVELRDPYTAGHQQKVTDLATAIAREMKLEDTRIEQLRTAAVIHDIGKMYVPSDTLSKPGKLSEIELGLIKTHSQSGYDIVKSMDFPCSVANTVLQHHERLDGSGYPNGLKGADILLEAKILAVADVVEAMASHRPYRPALGIDKAIEEISKNRGKLYDPDVVDTCMELFNSGKFEFKSV